MPGEERTRGTERCSIHTTVPSVARCYECGRAMCLACATPVRGRTLGAECLVTALGPDAPAPRFVERARGAAAMTVARAAFGLAVFASVLPWSRFGAGAQPFGAWASGPRWSTLAALASVAGFLLSMARRRSAAGTRIWDAASIAAGGLVVAGSLLALARPPAFTSSWLGPWVALGTGAVAVVASAVALRGDRTREPARV